MGWQNVVGSIPYSKTVVSNGLRLLANGNQLLGTPSDSQYGTANLRTLADNISNPNVNFRGDANPVNNTTSKKTNNNKKAGHDTTQHTTSNSNSAYGGSGSGGGSSADRAATLAYLGLQQSNLDRQMGRTGTTLEQGLTNLTNDYNNKYNTASQNKARAIEDLTMQRRDTESSKDKAIDKVNTNARVLADSLRRKIGMASGSGSSAYQITAPGAVARDASTERGDVLGTFAQNFRALDVADKRTNEDYDKLFSDLKTQREASERSLRQGVENTRNEISQKLAEIAAQRVAAQGGGLTQQMAAARGYENDIAARERAIDALGNVSPIELRAIQAQAPELAQYLVDRAAIQANQQAGTNDPTAPYGPNIKNRFEDDLELGY